MKFKKPNALFANINIPLSHLLLRVIFRDVCHCYHISFLFFQC